MSAFFLTGPVQSGKSTAIHRFLCANSALRQGGFLTVSIPTDAGFDVFIVPPVWTERDLTPEALVGRRGGVYGKYPEHFNGRGCALLANKNYTQAIDDFTRAINIDNGLAEAYYNRGLARIKNGSQQEGIADLSKAGELGLYNAYSVIKRIASKN